MKEPVPRKTATRSIQDFFRLEAASGVVLLVAALLALVWANSPLGASYEAFRKTELLGHSLHFWVNDALMTLFFFVVGLEVKRELLFGALATAKQASLPFAAALGGMIVPSLIYAAFNWGTPSIRGWGIPMATDIAFALGVLSLLGKRVPATLKVFLTALAIADDLGAVIVIALFYGSRFSGPSFLAAAAVFGALIVANKLGVNRLSVHGALGVVLWYAVLKSGVHPTIAGVLLAFAIPTRSSLVEKLAHALTPWVAFGVMPVFALANAGVSFLGQSRLTWGHPITLGVIAGLVFGKQIGICLFSWVSVRSGLSELPSRASWTQFYGASWLGGIGFTMSIFIAMLAFKDDQALAQAKLGIIVASVISGGVGFAIFAAENQALRRRGLLR